MYTEEDVLLAIQSAIIDRAAAAQEEEGGIDEDTQDEVDRLAEMAEPENVKKLLAEFNIGQVRMAMDDPRSVVDVLTDDAASAALGVADDLRREVRALAKKIYPRMS